MYAHVDVDASASPVKVTQRKLNRVARYSNSDRSQPPTPLSQRHVSAACSRVRSRYPLNSSISIGDERFGHGLRREGVVLGGEVHVVGC